MKTVSLASHEFHANLLYNTDGLAPFFACDSAVKQAGGADTAEFTEDGDRWRGRLSYQESNIVLPERGRQPGRSGVLRRCESTVSGCSVTPRKTPRVSRISPRISPRGGLAWKASETMAVRKQQIENQED